MTVNRFCQACGAPLAPGHRFCEACGQPIAVDSAGVPRSPMAAPPGVRPAPAGSNLGVALLVFLLILAIGGGAIWWFLWPKSPISTGIVATPSSPFSYSPTPSPSASTPSLGPSPSPRPTLSPTRTPTPSPSPTATPSSNLTPTPSATPSSPFVYSPTPTETPTLPTPSTSPATVVGELQAQSFVFQFLDALKNGSLSTASLMVSEHFKTLEPFYFSVPTNFYSSLEYQITRTEKAGETVWVYTHETWTGGPGNYKYLVIAGVETLLIDEVQPAE